MYVDIKSVGLRDIIRTVLREVRTASLDEDKPVVIHPIQPVNILSHKSIGRAECAVPLPS